MHKPIDFRCRMQGVVIILAGLSPIHEQEQYVDGILESPLLLVIGKRDCICSIWWRFSYMRHMDITKT